MVASNSSNSGSSTMSFVWQLLHQPIMLTVTVALLRAELQKSCKLTVSLDFGVRDLNCKRYLAKQL